MNYNHHLKENTGKIKHKNNYFLHDKVNQRKHTQRKGDNLEIISQSVTFQNNECLQVSKYHQQKNDKKIQIRYRKGNKNSSYDKGKLKDTI